MLRMTHDWTHPSFVNVLNSSIESDKNQLTVELIQKLFDRRFILSSQIKRKQNNVLNTLSETVYKFISDRLNYSHKNKRIN